MDPGTAGHGRGTELGSGNEDDDDPAGCFVATEGGERIGICVATGYGKIGFIGELIVAADSCRSSAQDLQLPHRCEQACLKPTHIDSRRQHVCARTGLPAHFMDTGRKTSADQLCLFTAGDVEHSNQDIRLCR